MPDQPTSENALPSDAVPPLASSGVRQRPEDASATPAADDNVLQRGSTLVIERPESSDATLAGNAVAVPDFPTGTLDTAISQKLAQYLGGSDALRDFQRQDEWGLCTQGQLAETDILQAYSLASRIPVIDDEDMEGIERFPQVTAEYLGQWMCVPVTWDSESVVLAAVTPYDLADIACHWRHVLGRRPSFYLARRSLVERLVAALYESANDDDALGDPADASEQALRDLASEAPIVRLVNDMFARALEMDASDIHVEPSDNELAIRFRVDGVLQTVMTPPSASYPAIASRLKLIGGLNIAERRLPQDGRTDMRIGRAQIDVRISSIPAMHGESIVLRILRKDMVSFELATIGMPPSTAERFNRLVNLPHGIILVVGPTGSGKTTTLYCAINMLNSEENKIITIEDPIEYQVGGITQMQVKPAIGLTFATGLRHIVRQDPDIILVGEIRDRETAEIALHAALTGHLVLSTLHTNDAVGAIGRLLDMGVEDFLLSSALVGVLSQRLVRKLCPDCNGSGLGDGRSCRACNGHGYRGRVGIFELLAIDDAVRQAIRDSADSATLNAIARQGGMTTLREDGDEKVRAGVTRLEEVARVCQLDA